MGHKEYEFIYKKSVSEEIKSIFDKANITDKNIIEEKLKAIREEARNKASKHFGQPYFNTATIAGMYRIIIKQLASDLHVELDSFA